MTELFMRRNLSGLEPADGAEMPRVKVGDVVKVRISQPRNTKHHRKFFALMKLVFENQEYYDTLDDLIFAVKAATGHCKVYEKPDGTTFFAPRSIAFSNMDQTAFNLFYDRVLELVCTRIIPGLDDGDLRVEIERIVA